MLASAYLRVEGQFPLIGVGGVDSAARAFAKIEAGASLVQLYSALAFKGLGLPGAIKQGLLLELERKRLSAHRRRDWRPRARLRRRRHSRDLIARKLIALASIASPAPVRADAATYRSRMLRSRSTSQIGTTTAAPTST